MKKSNFITIFILFFTIFTINSQSTEWSQVKIGGGGYITGMKIHPLNSNVQYFRTDVGGAYRWDSNIQQMTQIINFPASKKSYFGVAGIALHPSKQNIVYLAVDRANKTNTSKILYSTNQGNSWQEIAVPNGVKFGANGGRTGTSSNDTDREGQPIEINPNNPNELWVGSRGKGVWILDLTKNINSRWRRVPGIPDNSEEGSIRSIKFNPNNSNQILVGYATKGIYRSVNGGQSFELINNGKSDLKLVADMSFSSSGDKLFVAAKNKGIYRLDNPGTNKNWKKLNIPFSSTFRGYQTVTASPHSNDIVMASVAAATGNNLAKLQVSFNGGDTWTTKSRTNLTNTFTWKDVSKSAGAHTSQIVFDPNNSNKLYCTSWFGLWHTNNWKESTVQWSNERAKGHEEIVPSGLFAFPENTSQNKLGVNSADYVAIITKNPDSYNNRNVKPLMDDQSKVIKGVDITACERYPNNFILSSTENWKPIGGAPNYGALLYTTNGGNSYKRLNGYDRNWGRSLVAISSREPSKFVVVHGNQIHYTRDKGVSFSKANTPSLGNVVENNVFTPHRPLTQDFVTKQKFYLYDRTNGSVYNSTNGGKDWVKKGTLPTDNKNYSRTSLKAVPKNAGHLWFNHPSKGLYRSTNSGITWTKINSVVKAQRFALGKSRTNNGYPTIYMIGVIKSDNTEAVYRSTDQGNSWTKINDTNSLFLLSNPKHIAADRTEYGKVYIGIEGLGVWQGNIQGNRLSTPSLISGNDFEENVVYPNPTEQILNINTVEYDDITIIDSSGKAFNGLPWIAGGKTNGLLKLDVSHLKSGLYFITIRNNKNKETFSFVKN